MTQPQDGNTPDPLKDIMGKLFGDKLPDDCVVQAILNDERLRKIAEYDLTSGYTNVQTATPEKLQHKFGELKRIVQTKESTLAELETLVFNKYGVQEGARELAPEGELQPINIIGFSPSDLKPSTKEDGV